MASVPTTSTADTIEQRVVRLLGTWREQTAYLSSSTQTWHFHLHGDRPFAFAGLWESWKPPERHRERVGDGDGHWLARLRRCTPDWSRKIGLSTRTFRGGRIN